MPYGGQTAARIDERLGKLSRDEEGLVREADVRELIDGLLESAIREAKSENEALVGELRALVDYIGKAKGEVLSLRPRAVGTRDIPGASEELSAIVDATDEAAGRIMDAADKVGELAMEVEGDTGETLQAISTELYEASSFQDICGQRITKVMSTLKFLEERLKGLAETIGDQDMGEAEEGVEFDEEGIAVDAEKLLHGPQLEDSAMSQDDVDALLADFD